MTALEELAATLRREIPSTATREEIGWQVSGKAAALDLATRDRLTDMIYELQTSNAYAAEELRRQLERGPYEG